MNGISRRMVMGGLASLPLAGSASANDRRGPDRRVDLLGFSLGGFIAAQTASDDARIVPPTKGAELVRIARGLGLPAEQITYPGRGHGFDLAEQDPMVADAVARVVRFFRTNLAAT
jgi:carboxymethylenebutenolidase